MPINQKDFKKFKLVRIRDTRSLAEKNKQTLKATEYLKRKILFKKMKTRDWNVVTIWTIVLFAGLSALGTSFLRTLIITLVFFLTALPYCLWQSKRIYERLSGVIK